MLLPYGLESSLRRLPVMTLILMGLCLFGFILQQMFPGASPGVIQEKLFELNTFYYTYPGLEAPQHLRVWLEDSSNFSERLLQTAQAEGITASGSEQAEFKRMTDEFDTLLRSKPVWKFGFHAQGNPAGLVLHMFLHGSWFHLISNLWLLGLIGFKIEDLWGKWVLLGLYLSGGIVAALAHAAISGNSAPLVGASGAIAALMGAFLLRLYRTRIKFVFLALFFFKPIIRWFSLPAYVALVFWFLREGFVALTGQSGNVATWAHLVGFAYGVLAAFILRSTRLEQHWLTDEQKREDLTGSKDLDEAESYISSGMFKEAEVALLRYIQLHPEDAKAWEMLAKSQRHLNADYQQIAQKALQLYLKQNALRPAAHVIEEFDLHPSLKMVVHLLSHFKQPATLLQTTLAQELNSPYAPKAALLLAQKYPGPDQAKLLQVVYEQTSDLEWKVQLEHLIKVKA